MKNFIYRHKLCFKILIFLLLLFFGGYIALFPARSLTVQLILKVALGPTFKSADISFPKVGVIEIKNLDFTWKGKEIVFAPRAEILYSVESLKKGRIEEIIAYDPTVNITLSDVSSVNIVDAFGTSKDKKKTKGSPVPIDRITAVNATVNYSDLSYHMPIHEVIYDVNGYVSFNKERGVDLLFAGHNGEATYSYSFNDYEKDYSMRILLKKVNLNSELLQYAYDSPDLSDVKGVVDLDLTIASDGLTGDGSFKEGQVRYRDLDDLVTGIDGRVDFLGDRIKLDAKFDALGRKNNIFTVRYAKESGVQVDMILRGLPFTEAEKYKYLKEVELPFQGMVFNEVKVSLIHDEKKEFTAKVAFDSSEYRYLDIPFKNIQGVLVYRNDLLYIENFKTDMILDINGVKTDDKISMDMVIDTKKSKGNIKYDVKEIKNLIPEIKGEFDFTFGENFVFNNRSNIMNLSGEYIKKNKELILRMDAQEGKGLEVGYDFKENKLTKLSGMGTYSSGTYLLETKLEGDEEHISIDSFKLSNENLKMDIQGDLNLATYIYDLKFKVENVDLAVPFPEENLNIKGNFSGEIKGEKEKFVLNTHMENSEVNFYGDFQNISGDIVVDTEKTLEVNFEGEIGKAVYKDYFLEGFRLGGDYKDGIVKVNYLQNALMSLKGSYDLKSGMVDAKLELQNITEEKLNLKGPDFVLEKGYGSLRGKVGKGLVGSFDIMDMKIFMDGNEIPLEGKLTLKDDQLNIDRIALTDSILTGKYDLASRVYALNMKVSEKNIFKYLGIKNTRGTLNGKITARGRGKEIEVKGDLALVKNFYLGKSLPQGAFKGIYRAKNLTDGILNIDLLSVNNLQNQQLLSMKGTLDMGKEYLTMELFQQKLQFYKVQEFFKGISLEGSLNLNGKISGKLKELTYFLNVDRGNIVVDDVRFTGIQGAIAGNLEDLQIKNFKVDYLNNTMDARGDIKLKEEKYSIDVKSKDIDLSFLNIFLKKYKVENIKGHSEFNVNINDTGNTGYLKIQDLSLTSKDYLLTLDGVNTTIGIEKKQLKIKEFQGLLNNGNVYLKGYVFIPTSFDKFEESLELKNLDYELQLEMKNVEYSYEKYFKLFLSSDLFLKGETLRGSISIDKGEVKEIPTIQINIFKIVFDYLFKRDRSDDIRKDLGKGYEPHTTYSHNMNVDVIFMIRDGINVDIPYATAFVEDLKGNIYGQGKFIGEDGNLLFLGNVEVLNGSLSLNGTSFNVERAAVIFDKKKDYFPDINPAIYFDAKSRGWQRPITLSLNGNLKDMHLSTGDKWGEGEDSNVLASLFGGSGSNQNEASAFLLKGIIDSQSSVFLQPVSQLVKNIFHIQKFKIASNVVTSDTPNSENGSGYLGLGAYLEAEDSIYKDKIYWVAKANLMSQTQSDSTTREGNGSGTVDEYDFSVIYKLKPGFSMGVGVQKLPESYVRGTKEKGGGNLNYHIDFIFEKRYDSLMNIFNRK